jgi:succinate dehydrogenase / fumarate reductase cytochrome b subunit
MSKQQPAPVYLNLFRIRFPVGAVTSFAHRVSGVLLFLALPFFAYLLDLSLRGPDGFAAAIGWFDVRLVRLGSIIIAWSLLHHLFSGVRFLLIDLEVGVQRSQARTTAWLVNMAALVSAFVYAWCVL